MSTTRTYHVNGLGDRSATGTFKGKNYRTVARRLFGRDAILLPGEFAAWVNVYLPLKERQGRKVVQTGRILVGTMRPAEPSEAPEVLGV